MKYEIELKPRAIKDLKNVPKPDGKKIVEKLRLLEDGLQGDVKKLTNSDPEYRMRVGDWRVLFEIKGEIIIIYRVRHRKEAYR
ncbi:MAG: type II toxin-antitoxin system RelE/ParE family toxin [bacterium]